MLNAETAASSFCQQAPLRDSFKSDDAINALPTQASYHCGNFSGTQTNMALQEEIHLPTFKQRNWERTFIYWALFQNFSHTRTRGGIVWCKLAPFPKKRT